MQKECVNKWQKLKVDNAKENMIITPLELVW